MLPGQGTLPAAARGAPGRIPSPQSMAFPRLYDLFHLQGRRVMAESRNTYLSPQILGCAPCPSPHAAE